MEKETIKLPIQFKLLYYHFNLHIVIFKLFHFPNWNSLLFIGLFYVLVAFKFNTIVIINLVIQFFSVNSNKKYYNTSGNCICKYSNCAYLLFYYHLFSTIKITFLI